MPVKFDSQQGDQQKNAQDWVRQLRFSSNVNKQTMGVDTDRVTPQLLLASSNKLLGISRGQSQGDMKDSLQFQRIYGPVEYFAERIQKDGGSVARSMLWKATSKGNLDFIGSGSLQPHVNAVFHEINLSQFVDNSTPFDGIDNSVKVTRIGEGGVQDEDSVPVEMRLVQPSYYGYVDGVRTQDKSPGVTGYLTKNVKKGTDGKLYQQFKNMHTGELEWVDSQTAASKVVTTDEYLDSKDEYVYALGGPKGVRIVKRSDVDYILPNSDDAWSMASNTVPMMSGSKGLRLNMGCHHPETPMIVFDEDGCSHMVPAKRIGHMGPVWMLGCDKYGVDQLYKVRQVVTRLTQKKSKFKKIITESGRVLLTSAEHKWWVYDKGFKLAYADELKAGMTIPRSLFQSAPVRRTQICGVPVTREICILMGRVVRSLRATSYSYRVSYVKDPDNDIDQKEDIETALKQLGVKDYNFFFTRGVRAVSIKDPVFNDWISQNIGVKPQDRRIPPSILSLPAGYTSLFLDSYYKDLQSVGQDSMGDTWLLSIANPALRDSLAFMLSKIETDSFYRDNQKKDVVSRAMQLVPMEITKGNIKLEKISKIMEVPAPAVMIDIDCDDNVYAAGNGIITHNSKYISQAVPLQHGEAPLVSGLDKASGKSMSEIVGKLLGSKWAPKAGMVKAVREDRIDMVYDDGTQGSVPLYKDFPANAKGWLSNYPKVKAGDKVQQGQLLASSNYTDDKGLMATGRNLRVGYLSYKGGTYEDGCTISQSAAKKMAYTTMYKTAIDKDKSIRTAKNLYLTWKPGQYTREQLQNISDDGVVKPGTVLSKGDPVILGIRTTEPSPGTLGKRILSDVTQVWQHAHPGVVTDVVNGKDGIRVYAKVSSPLQEGDKITGFAGNKGTCYSEDTQVLTKHGWKYFKDLTDTDEVATLGVDGVAHFEKPSARQVFNYQGQMYGFKNKVISWLVTPDHYMWACPSYAYYRDRLSFKRLPVQQVWGQNVMCQTAALFQDTGKKTQVIIPEVQYRADYRGSKQLTWSINDFAAFLGFYLAQGSIGHTNVVRITQKRDLTDPQSCLRCDKIQALLTKMNLPWRRDGLHYDITHKALRNYLKQFGKSFDKFIPEQVFTEWPHEAQLILLEWLYIGDGQKFGKARRLRVTSPKLIDGAQRLYILNGYSTTTHHDYPQRHRIYKGQQVVYKALHGVSFSNIKYRPMDRLTGQRTTFPGYYKQLYDGKVYCCTVSTGVILVQRQGKPMWCGNCAKILPDDQMPKDSKGRPLEVLFDPLGIVSRGNPSALMQAALGKVAQKTGQPIVVPSFMPKGQSRLQYVKQMMKANNVPWKEDVTDPDTGRTIKNVFTGLMYFLPLKHIADTKMSARGTQGYTAQGVPASGGEHGCFPAMQNIMTIHGQKSIANICQKRIPEYVMSWDEEAKEWRWKQITDWFTYRAKTQDILNIFTQNAISTYGGRCSVKHTNSSYPTKNHKMYMADGSTKLAGQLKVGQYLAGIGCQYTEDQMQALLGTLMGDSCRTPDNGIQCMHSVKQRAYINYKRDIFAAVGASRVSEPREMHGTIKSCNGRIINYAPTASIHMQIPKSYWTEKALQMTTDSAGKRHLTIPVLEAMGEFGFCLWFLDDGSVTNKAKNENQKSQPQARIATHSFSVQEVQEAAKWLEKNLLHVQNGTRITIYKGVYDQDQPCLDFRREASWQIARIVAKHIPWDVIPDSKEWLKKYCKQTQEKTPCVKHNFLSPLGIVPLKIKEIKPYKHDKPNITEVNVYDFTVEDTHNYALSGGVRVSNSKRLGGLQSAALVGHNAFDFLTTDAKLIRGQQNHDFWRSLRSGQIPVIPGQPLVHKKFFAHLQGSGVQVKRDQTGVSIFALSNKDVNQLAGPRQLKSTDTYQQKSFRPISGGLFGTDVFGQNGDKWGYIQLDYPLPNPVMQEPLARLLNVTDSQFQSIIEGSQEVNGMSSAKDMKEALSKMDLQKEAVKALQQLKESSPSKKDAALKRYVAIARMRDAGVKPQEYMLDRIPVLPPQFRPITSHGGLTMVADSNYLYSQLLNARDDLREAQGLPQEYIQQGQANLYRKWKELTGLYDPSDVKLKAKSVKGLLKWALGSTPKFSGFQRKVLGSTVDTVGRGVVIPSTKVKLNEIGMPIEMAWDVYAPFVTRKLVKMGYTPVDALKLCKERKPVAFEALQEAVMERPVVMNRAPSLHKYSLMGFNVKLTNGHAIKVNPSIVSPFNMDFDGDSCKSLISIDLEKSLIAEYGILANQRHQIQPLTNRESRCILSMKGEKQAFSETDNNTKGEHSMFKADTKMELVHTVMELSELPVVEGSEVKKSDTVTEWDVKDGVYANTIDPSTGDLIIAKITKVSKHENLKMFDCNIAISGSYSHIVTVSEDHSLITYNPVTLQLEKSRPEDSVGRCVPMTRLNRGNVCNSEDTGFLAEIQFPSGKYPITFDMGLLFGLLIGDGWVANISDRYQMYIACCEESLQNNIVELSKKANMPFTKEASLQTYKASEGRFSTNDMQRIALYTSNEDKEFIRDLIGHGAENKHIPAQSFLANRAHLLGILMGLLATDGSVSHNPPTGAKKSPVKAIAYHTISPTLRDGVQELAHRLGVKTSVTNYIGSATGSKAYMVNFCLEDMVRLYDTNKSHFKIPVAYKQEAMERIVADIHENSKASCTKTVTSYDIVPFPRGLFCEFSWAGIVKLDKNIVIAGRAKGYIKRSVAKRIAEALERRDWSIYKDPSYLKKVDQTHRTPEEAKAMVDKWISIVRDENISWEVVEGVTPSTCTEGWDCTVPGPYTFSLNTGTVVQDTVNIHVPVSQAGIRDVRQKMLPERNLLSVRKHKIQYAPQKAYAQGLYAATRMGEAKDIKAYTLKEAQEAYRRGDIDIDTPIVIKKEQ